ncbi:MAG: helix-turn-helix transcriptional regulator [Rhodocyclales bacterium]|jgi:DNA-binding HxlR family transcriptional regulator|nr:helix-turn-helix transcriptional regulator [Rhodocyclales bacterium]MBI5786578.1 helix-turn-helix transcriptional regulator [Rhodocyclales bacterium]
MSLHKPKGRLAELCPIRDVLDRVSDRWSVLVMNELREGTLRFGELKARIEDISQRMLAQTLRRLEEDGLVAREVFPTIPPRVDYTLTGLGHSLLVPVQGMMQWAAENQEAVRAARRAYKPPPGNRAK